MLNLDHGRQMFWYRTVVASLAGSKALCIVLLFPSQLRAELTMLVSRVSEERRGFQCFIAFIIMQRS